jgi:hypothetical protein
MIAPLSRKRTFPRPQRISGLEARFVGNHGDRYPLCVKSCLRLYDRFWQRKAVVEVWMLDLAGSRWLDLVQTPLMDWTDLHVVPPTA